MGNNCFISDSIHDLDHITGQILKSYSNYKIFYLSGDLGSGKTELVKHFVRKLEINDKVTSPTFSLVQEYQTGSNRCYHMDLYRIESLEELHDLNLLEFLDSGNYCFVEWPHRLKDLYDLDYIEISMEILSDGKRKIIT